MNGCIFCKIVKGEIPYQKIYEDEKTLAFLDIRPASPKGGHTLVIPKKHYANLVDLPVDVLEALARTIKKVTKALGSYFGEGLNILQNNGIEAGQIIMHVHFHLIPRFKGDGIEIGKWKENMYPEGTADKLAEEIKKLL